MRLPNPLDLAARIAGPVAETLRSFADPGSPRRVWTADDQTHLEVRGVHRPGTEDAATDLRDRLIALDGVRAAEVNSVLGRVAVQHDSELVSGDELAEVVAEVEQAWELDRHGLAPASATHPANVGPATREIIAIGINLAGFGFSVLGKVLPIRVLPPAVPALLSLVDSTPRVRAEVEAKLGRPMADAIFALGGAVGHLLAQRPLGSLTDVGYRVCLHRELVARQRAWRQWAHSAADHPHVYAAEPLDAPPRPVPLPNGPVERVANTLAASAVAGYGGVLALTRNSQRALGVLHAGVPRAAKLGREAFAAQLSTDLSNAQMLVLEPDALRRFDRVDTVVLDASTLLKGPEVVDHVVVTDEDVDPAEVVQHAHDLVDTGRPNARRERDGWAVVPITELAGKISYDVQLAAQEEAGLDVTVLIMLFQTRPVGIVRVVPEIDALADALVDAARHAGTVVLGGGGEGLGKRLGLDQVVPGGGQLLESVRVLQTEGHVVAVVSADGREALAAADVGIGVSGRTGTLPWGADVVGPSLARACLLLDAVPIARRTSRHSAELAVAGSSLGAVLGGLGPPSGAPSRAAFPVLFAAMLALVVGTWEGAAPGRRSAPVPTDRTPWHAMSSSAVLTRLGSSAEGLDDEESERRRLAVHGEADPTDVGLARASVEELGGPLTPALAAGAGVSASLGSIMDALMISSVLALNALIGGAQRVGANRELHQLQDTTAVRVRLRRAGIQRTERAGKLVPGDVIELHAGDAVPADCRLLEAVGLEVDESSLTGESQLVSKSAQATAAQAIADRSSMLYQGSVIAAGRAVCAVVAVGEQTEVGHTSRLGGDDVPTTGVAARLRTLTRVTLPITLGAGAALMVADLLRGRGISQALGRAVSLSVAAVPEGLPFVATVAELASARRLAARGILARSPSTIEALGRVDVLCFDKTGTLTEGRVSLQRVSDGRDERQVSDLTPTLRDTLAVAVRASPWHEADRPLPHPADRAVLDAARQAGVAADHGLGELEWTADLPFESSRGYHAVLAQSLRGPVLSVKGAPETVLARCRRWRRPEGWASFDADARKEVESNVERLARQGYRVLAVAERAGLDQAELDESAVQDLDFYGLLALADPVRPTAAAAVDEMTRAGVDIVMITGDHPSTAEAIAAELNVLNGGGVLTGAEIEALDDEQLAPKLAGITVFARVSPAQKARIVRLLRDAGRVVAMTGDGANDVPAIRLAHVGIALGARATPAAREAADLVVTDDHIETITAAIIEGRAMWSSVRDALSILLGGNLGEVAFTVGAGLFSSQEALNARQLLLVNLLTDVLPAMAVAVRPPPHKTPEELLAEGPEASLGASLNSDIYIRAATTAGAAMAGWLLARPVSTPAQATTAGLVALVAAQLGQTMAVRGSTPLVIAAGVGSLAAMAAIVQIPGVSQFFGCSPLLPHQWGIALGAAGAAVAVEMLSQASVRRRRTR
jgi:cation-transporting ATPase I